jgi:hypothetical protein
MAGVSHQRPTNFYFYFLNHLFMCVDYPDIGAMRAGGLAQAIDCLPSKPEALSSNFRATKDKNKNKTQIYELWNQKVLRLSLDEMYFYSIFRSGHSDLLAWIKTQLLP